MTRAKPDWEQLGYNLRFHKEISDDRISEELEDACWNILIAHCPVIARQIADLVLCGMPPWEIASKSEEAGASPILVDAVRMACRYHVRMDKKIKLRMHEALKHG